MPEQSIKYDLVAEFAETLDFYFMREGPWCYPDIELTGGQGTSANLHGQHMTPDDIENLGKALIRYAESLRKAPAV